MSSGMVENSRYNSQLINEDEVCQKLIELSFVKIVNSKHERGGAKLHKNMMILHLLQKARLEHRRSSESPTEEMEQFGSLPSEHHTIEFTEESESEADDSNLRIDSANVFDENYEQDDDSDDRPSPLLRFVSVEEEDVDTEVIEISSSQFTQNVQRAAEPKVIVQSDEEYYFSSDWDNFNFTADYPDEETTQSSESTTFTIISATSKSKTSESKDDSGFSSSNSSSSSSSSSSDEDSSDDSTLRPSVRDRRRRKRKHRSPSNGRNSCAAWKSKKTCCSDMDSAQLSGLISVFRQAGIGESTLSAARLTENRDKSSEFCLCRENDSCSGSCGAETTPSRSLSCPSLLELACTS